MISTDFTLRVIYADTDKMGRVYYAKYYEYFEAARSHLLREVGLPYSEIEKMGVFLPVIESHCVYKGGATFEDVLTVRTAIHEFPASKVRIDYEVLKNGGGSNIAHGYTIHFFMNARGKAVRPPKVFLDVLRAGWKTGAD
ncbi:MAG: acyl-CoA thioesterase [Fidelibacterota bacterium]